MFTKAKRGFESTPGRQLYRPVAQDWDPATAPECVQCGADYNPARKAKGYETCLDCGTPANEYSFIPTHKGAYVPITAGTSLVGLYNDKRAD